MSDEYEIDYADDAVADIKNMRKVDQRSVVDGIELHLSSQPTFTSKSRIKAMVQPFWSQYRLRIADFRVYYDVDVHSRRVQVLRILHKTTKQTLETPP